jgi:acyl-CoA synthetase (NDP forming)
LATTKRAPLLQGVRGEAPADLEALVDVMVKLSNFAADFAGEIAEIDLNPVLVHAQGSGVSIVDALMIKTTGK